MSHIPIKIILIFLPMLTFFSCSEKSQSDYNELTKEEHYILIEKGTEAKYLGIFNDHYEKGIYLCKQCNEVLFGSTQKFDSKSGWPSFDDFIPGKVNVKVPDAVYTEITCGKCDGHLGHVKSGENFSPKNKRYCVNSLSLSFKKAQD